MFVLARAGAAYRDGVHGIGAGKPNDCAAHDAGPVVKDARSTIAASFKSFEDFKGDVSVEKVGRWLRNFEQKVIDGKVLQRRVIDGRTCWYVSIQPPF